MVRDTHPAPAAKPARAAPHLPRLEVIERAGPVLRRSSIRCPGRPNDATINVTAGCPHRCAYCYARSYRNYPGDDVVRLYGNLVDKLHREMAHTRRLPRTVLFSSSSDAFAPFGQVQRVTYEAMRLLLERGVSVSFLTKGYIRRPFYWLFRRHRALVHARIGLSTVNPRIAAWLEPLAATPKRRLRNIRRLQRIGLDVAVRVDPMVPYVTDTPEQLTVLCRQLASLGIRRAAASYLFLRPRLIRPFIRPLPGPTLRRRLLDLYEAGVTVPLHGDGYVIRLPAAKYRMMGYERLGRICSRFGIELRVCTCKNMDLGLEACCDPLTATVYARREPRRAEPQLELFGN